MTRYEIMYRDADEWGEYSLSEIFDGTWDELRERIKELKLAGLWDIEATALYELDGSAEQLEAQLNTGI